MFLHEAQSRRKLVAGALAAALLAPLAQAARAAEAPAAASNAKVTVDFAAAKGPLFRTERFNNLANAAAFAAQRPSDVQFFNQNGLRVATVSAEDRIVFKPVVIARDLGKNIELASGLALDDRVVVAPPDGIVDGDKVRVAGQDKARKPATASTTQGEKG